MNTERTTQVVATPRRIDTLRFTPAERAIYDAVLVVERMGADVRLTEAVILLTRAREKVADYVDDPTIPGDAGPAAAIDYNSAFPAGGILGSGYSFASTDGGPGAVDVDPFPPSLAEYAVRLGLCPPGDPQAAIDAATAEMTRRTDSPLGPASDDAPAPR